jgi:hypothetical protein
MSWDEWEPLVRVGRPKFNVSAGGSVKVRLWIKGQLHDDWRGYFGSQVSLQRLDAAIDGFDSGWDSARRVGRYHVSGSCSPDDTEHYIEMLDAAIDYANTKFQADVLPQLHSRQSRHVQAGEVARQQQVSLDQLAKKLAKPE